MGLTTTDTGGRAWLRNGLAHKVIFLERRLDFLSLLFPNQKESSGWAPRERQQRGQLIIRLSDTPPARVESSRDFSYTRICTPPLCKEGSCIKAQKKSKILCTFPRLLFLTAFPSAAYYLSGIPCEVLSLCLCLQLVRYNRELPKVAPRAHMGNDRTGAVPCPCPVPRKGCC